MSIYCSIFDFGFQHSQKCKRIHKISPGTFEQDNAETCTCGSCPLQYQGSTILPSSSDDRNGCFGLAAIPSHITIDRRDDGPEDRKWHPWLRVHLFEGHENTVILDRHQVAELREALGNWLRDSHPTRKRKS